MKEHNSGGIQFYKEKVKPPFGLHEGYTVYTLGNINGYPTIVSGGNFKEETSLCDKESEAMEEITSYVFSNIKLLDDQDSVLIDIDNASLEIDRDGIYDDHGEYPDGLTGIQFAEAIEDISGLSIFIRNESFFKGREYIDEMLGENFKLIITE